MEKILDFLFENYLIRGFYLLPINRESKLPFFKKWQEKSSNDLEQIKKWAEAYPDCNWAILPKPSGHIAIDVDLDKPENKHFGMTTWQALLAQYDEPNTWKQVSGSGGFHYLFKADSETSYAGTLLNEKGVQTRYLNYIVIEPSIHPKSKKQYKIVNHSEPIDVPSWLLPLITKVKKEKGIEAPTLSIGLDYLKQIGDQLKLIPLDRDRWLKIGMALHAISDAQEYLDLWIDISKGPNYTEGDEDSCEYRWGGFSSDRENILTGNSFIYLARSLGCNIPNPTLAEDRLSFAMMESKRIEIEAEIHPDFWEEDGKQVCRHKDFIVNFINDLGYASVQHNPEGAIIRVRNEDSFLSYSQLDPKQTKTNFRTHFYKYYKWTSSKGYEPKYKPAYDVWFEHCQSKTFTEICFDHKERPGSLNMFVPIPCAPIMGNVNWLQDLVENAICQGDKKKAKWLLQWFAHIIQKPHEKCSLIPAVIGEQGTGKGLLFITIMQAILKNYHLTVENSETITDRFNSHLAFRLLTVLDEASWNGNHKESNMLKTITGNEFLMIEEKFGKKVKVKNYSRYALLSNSMKAFAMEASNRRFVPFETNDDYAQRKDYFHPMFEFMRKEAGAGMVFNYLLNFDISDFDPHFLPKFDNQGQEAREATEGPIAQYWIARFGDDPKPIFTEDGNLKSTSTYMDFLEFKKENGLRMHNIVAQSFWRQTFKIIPILKRAPKVQKTINTGDRTTYLIYSIGPEEMKESLEMRMSVSLDTFSYFDLIDMGDFGAI